MHSTDRSDGRVIAALVATRRRDELLLGRCLPSITRQTRPPDLLVVVVDERDEERFESVGRLVREAVPDGPPVVMLRNYRTPGASGAWNTGIDWLLRPVNEAGDPGALYVAILDDDDAWEPNHLEVCERAVGTRNAHMAVAGLVRHESAVASHASGREMGETGPGVKQSIPDHLDARAFFIKNPHIQGSNLFVRLDSLASAGMFDEHLTSCTDRDLCIRLFDVPGFAMTSVQAHTVHHYAEAGRSRLSTPGSTAKSRGLDAFFYKHSLRFDQAAVNEAQAVAFERFGWQPPAASPSESTRDLPAPSQPKRPVHIVAGFTTDVDWPQHADRLMCDLCELACREGVAGLDVVIVENGPLPVTPERPVQTAAAEWRRKGLSVFVVTIEDQARSVHAGGDAAGPRPGTRRLPIPVTRTVVAQYVRLLCHHRPGSVAWILDDDKRLSFEVEQADGTTATRTGPDLAAWENLRQQGIDVVLGPDTGAAPLPLESTIRMPLVDLAAHLAAVINLGSSASWPDRSAEVAALRSVMRDTYYDLARTTEHLETPQWLACSIAGTARAVLEWMAERVPRIRAGEQVFRPLTVPAADLAVGEVTEWVQRGGSAVFFDPVSSLAVPQSFARLDDRPIRRSDTLVTTILRDELGQRIVRHASAAVHHDRSTLHPKRLDMRALIDDVLGYAVSRAFEECNRTRERFIELVRKYGQERLAAFDLSLRRSKSLCGQCRNAVARLPTDPAWKSQLAAVTKLDEFLNALASELREIDMQKVAADVDQALTPQPVGDLFDRANAAAASTGVMDIDPAQGKAWLVHNRTRSAIERTNGRLGLRALEVLGTGAEGIVLKHGPTAFKVIDYVKPKNHDGWARIRSLIGHHPSEGCIPTPHATHALPGGTLLVCSYEPSAPYEGGLGRAWVRLLRGLKALGIACRNINARNVRVIGDRLQLVDLGGDIVAWSEVEYRQMAKRAFLTWRWWRRDDLAGIMRRALTDDAIPELTGFENFWTALNDESPSVTGTVASIVDPLVLESVPSGRLARILDYGCGKKAMSAINLANRRPGWAVVGFDPGSGMEAQWARRGPTPSNLVLTTNRDDALRHRPFDAAICSLVLCGLEDGPAYEQVLLDLRASVSPDSVIIVTVCNPFFTFGGPTPIHTRRDIPPRENPPEDSRDGPPGGAVTYDDNFWFVENADQGPGHREFHRPLRRLERDLLRHGIRVERALQDRTVDLERFEPASDFLVLVCRPAEIRLEREVSLVIKACAMEWQTIERQVEHLTRQLEGPRVFHERVLSIDSKREGLVRPYATSNYEALVAAAERLRLRGYIDKVVTGPGDGPEALRINRDWFGVESPASHSLADGPLAAHLQAFEQCQCEYILQVDADLLIGREHREHDYLGELIAAVEADPAALTASLNIVQRENRPFTTGGADGLPWRVEVRGCLFHKARLLAARPFANRIINNRPEMNWHRALDRVVVSKGLRSLRGGPTSTSMAHPPNSIKSPVADWMLLIDLVEKGLMPSGACQLNSVNVVGGPLDHIPAARTEPFVFVITGRNVPPGRAARCLESVLAQRRTEWGAVIIDDASDCGCRDYLRLVTEQLRARVTLLQPPHRRGQLDNTALAVRRVCTNPQSIIITLDLDDCLTGADVLDRVAAAYSRGADVTVGSMLRTDKGMEYHVSFENPRGRRGGNVWQHLRSFRKALFDAIPDADLRVDGRYVDIAVDWAFMIPIVELAAHPVWIREALYLYELSGLGKGEQRAEREREIAVIMAKPSRRPAALVSSREEILT